MRKKRIKAPPCEPADYSISRKLSLILVFGVFCCGCNLEGFQITRVEAEIDFEKAYIDARTTLLQGAVADDLLTRVHAMEAIGRMKDPSSATVLVQGLESKNTLVRFASAMAIGDIGGYKPAAARLEAMAEDPKADTSVICACIYALHTIGHDKHMNELGRILMGESVSGRANAAMVMGKMNEQSAIGPLQALMVEETDPRVKYNAVEALAKLGNKRAISIMESYVKGYYLDLRLAAIPVLTEINHPRTKPLLENLMAETKPPRVRISAAGGLGVLGIADGYTICIRALEDPQEILSSMYGKNRPLKTREIAALVSSLRRLAAISLGKIRNSDALGVLLPLLQDHDGSVRIAAAMSVVEILFPGNRGDLRGKKPVTAGDGSGRGGNTQRLYTSGGID